MFSLMVFFNVFHLPTFQLTDGNQDLRQAAQGK